MTESARLWIALIVVLIALLLMVGYALGFEVGRSESAALRKRAIRAEELLHDLETRLASSTLPAASVTILHPGPGPARPNRHGGYGVTSQGPLHLVSQPSDGSQ